MVAVAWDGQARGLLTGDNGTVARAVAAEVGIDDVVAGVLPEGKVEEVQRLQRQGRWSRWSATG